MRCHPPGILLILSAATLASGRGSECLGSPDPEIADFKRDFGIPWTRETCCSLVRKPMLWCSKFGGRTSVGSVRDGVRTVSADKPPFQGSIVLDLGQTEQGTGGLTGNQSPSQVPHSTHRLQWIDRLASTWAPPHHVDSALHPPLLWSLVCRLWAFVAVAA